MEMIRQLDRTAIHWTTPREIWEIVKEYLPTGPDDVIWEPFYNEQSRSAEHLRSLGCKVIAGNVDFFKQKVPLGTHIVTNPPWDCKEEIIKHLALLDIPFMITLPLHSLATRFIKRYLKHKLQIIIPDTRLHYEKKNDETGEVFTLKRTPFDSAFFCYKMNLKSDIIWL